jgi:xanthine dehydrogenase accessory factor
VHVLLVGDGPVTAALEPMVAAVGWTPTVATDLAAVADALPDSDAVVVLSHHEEVDSAAILAALEADTPYVGAMGSRRTQERRRAWLAEQGADADLLSRLHAPVGLDIGADEPGEIAVSVLAEIVAVRRGAAGQVGSIRDRDGAIHPGLDAGEASCPGG